MSGRILPPTFSDLRPGDPRQVGRFTLLGRLGTGVGVQREVGYFTFDYSDGVRISDFDPVTMIEPASQCT